MEAANVGHAKVSNLETDRNNRIVFLKKNAATFRETKVSFLPLEGKKWCNALQRGCRRLQCRVARAAGRRRFILAAKTMALNLAECRSEELKSACV